LDIAWYLLADAQENLREQTMGSLSLETRLTGGPIPRMENILARSSLASAMRVLDVQRFAESLQSWLSVRRYLSLHTSELDILAPERGEVPLLKGGELLEGDLVRAGKNIVLAFEVIATMRGKRSALENLGKELKATFGEVFPGETLLDAGNPTPAALDELGSWVLAALRAVAMGGHMPPHQVWMIALRILEQAELSVFRNEMIEALAGWLRAEMTRIIEHETFRLSRPLSTVPPIREVLAQATSARRFVVLLILASDEAVGGNLGEAYREKLRGIAADAKA
jgi:hypothetical protein